MKKEQEKFYSISLLSVYVYMRNEYDDLGSIKKEEDSKDNIESINKMLLKLDKYAHISNQELILKQSYEDFLNHISEGNIDEEVFFDKIKLTTQNLNRDEKEYILNSIIFIANEDKIISDKEKKIIIQVAHILSLDTDFKKILKSYKSSEFVPSISNKIIFSTIILFFTLILVSIYFYYTYSKNDINIFNKHRVVFSDVSFNRFVVYKNKYNVENDYFKKQAIFYISGKAEVGFNPQNISYNKISETLTLSYKEDKFFEVKPIFNPLLVVDRVNPKSISKEDAKKVGAVVGIAGAIGGAKAGNTLGKVFPKPYNFVATGAGAAIGGLTGFFITSSALEGMKISKDISPREEDEVYKASKVLITELLARDKKLQELYKERFEKYIKFKYSLIGLKIKNIDYKEIKK